MSMNYRALALVAVAAGFILAASPSQASAQGKSHDKSQGKSKDHVVVQSQAVKSKNGNGPAFCRSGSGHPQFGRQWCVDKGFGLGNSQWSNAGWGDVVLRRPSSRSSTTSSTVNSGTLADILGRVVFGRLQSQSNGGALSGLWLTPATGPVVLQVTSSGRPIAEFVDRNRDGRTEVVLLKVR